MMPDKQQPQKGKELTDESAQSSQRPLNWDWRVGAGHEFIRVREGLMTGDFH